MIKHLVMWKFKSGAPVGEIKARLEAMKNTIPFIQQLEVGVDFLKSSRSWDMVLTVIFNSEGDLELYGNHPAHVPVAAFIGQWKESGASVDYRI